MTLRWRKLSDEDAKFETATGRGLPIIVAYVDGRQEWVVLERQVGEGSAEGASWEAVEIR